MTDHVLTCPKCGNMLYISKSEASAILGKAGGSAKSEKKTLAVRENAKRSWINRKRKNEKEEGK